MKTFTKSKKEQTVNNSAPKFFKHLDPLATERMFSKLSVNLTRDKRFWFLVSLWLLPLIFVAIYSVTNFPSLPDQIPLFYSHVWGEKQLAQSKYIFLPTVSVGIFGLVDIIFALGFYNRNRVVSYLLVGAAALTSVLCAITTFNIINLMR